MTNESLPDQLELEEKKELPSMLNVLTILTFIGAGIGGLLSIKNYFSICKTVDMVANKEMPEVGGFLGKFISNSLDLLTKQCESRLVILVSSLVTSLLCIFGAYMMRQKKKQGFMVYILGEILAPASFLSIMGVSTVSILTNLMSFIVALIMIVLYST